MPKSPKTDEVVPFPSPAVKPLDPSRLRRLDELSPAELDERAAIHAAIEVREGKPEQLANRLAAGAELHPLERSGLVLWLRGEIRNPAHRPPESGLLGRKFDAFFMVRRLREGGEKEEGATRAAAEHFGVSQGTIRQWVRDCRK